MPRYGPPPHLLNATMDKETRRRLKDLGAPNKACVCANLMGAMLCPYGHMLECHYPMTCEEAECAHYQQAQAEEAT